MALRPGDFVVGPGGAQAGRLVGGLTSTTVHFPRALGTPAASCQPPLFAFARSYHLHLLPHYLLLIVSGERLSFCLPVCLAFLFPISLSLPLLSFSLFPLLLHLCLSPCLFFIYRGRNQGIGASAGFPLENQFVALSLRVGVTDRAHSYCLSTKISIALLRGRSANDRLTISYSHA